MINKQIETNNEIITRVFKHKYLLFYILKRININNTSFLGVEIPSKKVVVIGDQDLIDDDDLYNDSIDNFSNKNTQTYHFVAKKYTHLAHDLLWVVRHGHYGVLKELISTKPPIVDEITNTFIHESATIDDPSVIGLVLSIFCKQFKDYLESNNQGITQYLLSLVTTHGNIGIWRLVTNFINDHCLDEHKKNKNKKGGPSFGLDGISVLQLVSVDRHDEFVTSLLQLCILKSRDEIMEEIVTAILDGSLPIKTKKMVPSLSYKYRSSSPLPNLESRILIQTTLDNLYTRLPMPLYYNIVIRSPLAFMTDNINILSNLFESNPIYHLRAYLQVNPIRQDTCNEEMKQKKNILFQLLTKYKDQLKIDADKIDSNIQPFYSSSSPQQTTSSIEYTYNMFWVFELCTMINGQDDDTLGTSQKQIISLIKQNKIFTNDLVNYLLDRCGFTIICRFGSKRLVESAFIAIMMSKTIEIQADTRNLLKDLVSNRPQWDVIEFLVLKTGLTFETDYNIIKRILTKGGLNRVAIHLATPESMSRWSANMADISTETITIPSPSPTILSQDNEKNIQLLDSIIAKYLVNNDVVHFIAILKELRESSYYLPVIKYLDGYFKQKDNQSIEIQSKIDNLVKNHYQISLDYAIQKLDLEMVQGVVEIGIPFKIEYPETWRIVGQYGSVEWISTFLLIANSYDRQLSIRPFYHSLKEGALLNHNLNNRNSILNFIKEKSH
ncbi:hypothetical protein DFA_06259 [Cavenderia fasciculata]|uniref:Uncharacterized protein n=1 Tax=Cavenderia fasciculata TaxID=261658 RepID=F4PKJ6_CACFS|nr:uncharacterized protein DFA_06259 [Cavenderia fasciculata]EGG24120.1 hypothetical protein DFA_06259 [Cavenderia fasciculata]|eukprot:XP_004361971.1 hypothetical protein DFA_06259 [Cavenderia fasciculata]